AAADHLLRPAGGTPAESFERRPKPTSDGPFRGPGSCGGALDRRVEVFGVRQQHSCAVWAVLVLFAAARPSAAQPPDPAAAPARPSPPGAHAPPPATGGVRLH